MPGESGAAGGHGRNLRTNSDLTMVLQDSLTGTGIPKARLPGAPSDWSDQRMSFYIRRMREEDIPQVVEIEKIAFSRPWSKSIFKATLLLPYAAYYVAVEDGESSGSGEDASGPSEEDSDSGEEASGPRGEAGHSLFWSDEAARQKIVGMCGVKKIFEEGEISNVAVHPDFRGKGLSRKMLEMLMSEAREDGVQAFTLEVRAGNGIAIRLYESLGFRTEGVRREYYDHPVEDGLIMWQRPEPLEK